MLRRIALISLFLAGAAYLALAPRRRAPGEGEAPPPPPPAIELPPAPALSESELSRIRISAKDADPQVRWAAVELLYRLRDPAAVRLLQEVLTLDSEPEVRRKAVEMLQRERAPAAARDLLLSLKDQDQDKDIRVAALLALGEVGDHGVAPAVAAMLNDYEPEVRKQALHTMGRFQEKRQAEHQALVDRLKAEYAASLEKSKASGSRDVKRVQ